MSIMDVRDLSFRPELIYFDGSSPLAAGRNLSPYGFRTLDIVYEFHIWPNPSIYGFGNLNTPEARATYHEGQIRAYCQDVFAESQPEYLCLDIEHWPLYYTEGAPQNRTPYATQQTYLDNLIAILDIFKDELPNTLIGFYTLAPFEPWYDANGLINDWSLARVEEGRRLIDEVQVFFPETYPYYFNRDKDDFRVFAAKIIEVTRGVANGRKIFPFTKPFITSGGVTSPMNIAEWINQMDSIINGGADGLVFWGSENLTGFTGPPGDDFYNSTKSKIESYGFGISTNQIFELESENSVVAVSKTDYLKSVVMTSSQNYVTDRSTISVDRSTLSRLNNRFKSVEY